MVWNHKKQNIKGNNHAIGGRRMSKGKAKAGKRILKHKWNCWEQKNSFAAIENGQFFFMSQNLNHPSCFDRVPERVSEKNK